MTNAKRGRGRPPKPFFENGDPKGKPKRELSALTIAGLEGWREWERGVRSAEGCGPYLGLDAILANYAESTEQTTESLLVAREKQHNLARAASSERASNWSIRKRQILDHPANQTLCSKVERGELSCNAAARQIQNSWSKRGDGGSVPGIRTLNRWLAELCS